MAITADSIKAFTAKVKTLTKDQAIKFLEDNKNKIKWNPELQKAVTAAYAEAFTNVPTSPSSLNISNKSSTPVTTAAANAKADAMGQKNGVVPPASNTIKVPGAVVPQVGGTPWVITRKNDVIENPPAATTTTNPIPTTTVPSTTATTTPVPTTTTTLPAYSFKGAELGTGKDVSFTPTRTAAAGFAINDNGNTDQEKLGLTDAQQADLLGYGKNLKKNGVWVVEQTKLIADLIKKYQSNNLDIKTYWVSYGTKPEGIPTDPTTGKKTVGSMIDLNNNGIPDSQEGYGVDTLNDTPLKDVNLTKSVVTVPNIDVSNLSALESTALEYAKSMADYEAVTKTSAAEAEAWVTSAAAKRIIDTNNEYIGAVTGLLDERLSQNRQQYLDAVGGAFQAAGGQVKAIQRVIGSDGVVMDDITALALIGEQGQVAMQKVIDLKNDLVNSYLKQKQEAIDAIYALKKDNAITQNEADEAINAIQSRAKSDVIDITKDYYKQVFGVTDGADARAENTASNTRAAVTGYLAALGMTGLQQNQLINNYVKDGYSTEEALAKLAEDIRDKKNPVITWSEENNADAAAAAAAAFEQQMALKIEPILAKWQVDLDLQNDKQAFDAEQASLDRALKRAGMIAGSASSGSKKITQATWEKGYAAFEAAKLEGDVDGVFPTTMTEDEFRVISNSLANPDLAQAQAVLKNYGLTANPETNGTYAAGLKASAL